MHIPTDAGTWGLILSIVGILLIYPVGVYVNVTTPKLQDWWAARSKATLMKQLHGLEAKLARAEKFQLFDEFQESTTTRVSNSKKLVIYSATGILFAIYVATATIVLNFEAASGQLDVTKVGSSRESWMDIVFMAGYLFFVIGLFWVKFDQVKMKVHFAAYRQSLSKRIDMLRTKTAK